MSDVQRALLEHTALRQLQPGHLAALTGCARLLRFGPEEWLFRTGEHASSIILVLSGRVALASPHGTPVGALLPGDVYGTSWLRAGERWPNDGQADEPTETLQLDGTCVRRKCRTDPELGFELASRLLLHAYDRLDQLRRG